VGSGHRRLCAAMPLPVVWSPGRWRACTTAACAARCSLPVSRRPRGPIGRSAFDRSARLIVRCVSRHPCSSACRNRRSRPLARPFDRHRLQNREGQR